MPFTPESMKSIIETSATFFGVVISETSSDAFENEANKKTGTYNIYLHTTMTSDIYTMLA